MEQNASETPDNALPIFCIYSPAPDMQQEMPCEICHFWENISGMRFTTRI